MKVWWRLCARYWQRRATRCARQAADARSRAEKYFRRVKGLLP